MTGRRDRNRLPRCWRARGVACLLDIGHARVSAATLGADVHGYLADLPLERVVQIHVSGPRMRDGRLVDAHEPLEDADYALLDWVLARTQPQVVTLEYIREREALSRQLGRLRERIGSGNGGKQREHSAAAGPAH